MKKCAHMVYMPTVSSVIHVPKPHSHSHYSVPQDPWVACDEAMELFLLVLGFASESL